MSSAATHLQTPPSSAKFKMAENEGAAFPRHRPFLRCRKVFLSHQLCPSSVARSELWTACLLTTFAFLTLPLNFVATAWGLRER